MDFIPGHTPSLDQVGRSHFIEHSALNTTVKNPYARLMATHRGILAKTAFEVPEQWKLLINQLAYILYTKTKTLRSYLQNARSLISFPQ